eukprot:5262268-Pyramimonas_sp.AAC.1
MEEHTGTHKNTQEHTRTHKNTQEHAVVGSSSQETRIKATSHNSVAGCPCHLHLTTAVKQSSSDGRH